MVTDKYTSSLRKISQHHIDLFPNIVKGPISVNVISLCLNSQQSKLNLILVKSLTIECYNLWTWRRLSVLEWLKFCTLITSPNDLFLLQKYMPSNSNFKNTVSGRSSTSITKAIDFKKVLIQKFKIRRESHGDHAVTWNDKKEKSFRVCFSWNCFDYRSLQRWPFFSVDILKGSTYLLSRSCLLMMRFQA